MQSKPCSIKDAVSRARQVRLRNLNPKEDSTDDRSARNLMLSVSRISLSTLSFCLIIDDQTEKWPHQGRCDEEDTPSLRCHDYGDSPDDVENRDSESIVLIPSPGIGFDRLRDDTSLAASSRTLFSGVVLLICMKFQPDYNIFHRFYTKLFIKWVSYTSSRGRVLLSMLSLSSSPRPLFNSCPLNLLHQLEGRITKLVPRFVKIAS
ncbi:hypothetical protein DY000_02002347 [Brassica cretica]|uniref:Uncharacterized protein n=1 Tax=Brassica cretica TaxID=69181 RepID=A0ABQ7C8C3_BRACR|nr:hypothetical protein DY000_02002347 [Brassica cretica]